MNDVVNDFMVNARKAFEPVGKLGDLGTAMFEKTVDLQVQIATDVLNFTTNQLEAVSSFESPTQYLETQRDLATEYTGRAQAHAKAYLENLAEAQKVLSGWTEEATATVAAAAKPAKRRAPRKKAA